MRQASHRSSTEVRHLHTISVNETSLIFLLRTITVLLNTLCVFPLPSPTTTRMPSNLKVSIPPRGNGRRHPPGSRPNPPGRHRNSSSMTNASWSSTETKRPTEPRPADPAAKPPPKPDPAAELTPRAGLPTLATCSKLADLLQNQPVTPSTRSHELSAFQVSRISASHSPLSPPRPPLTPACRPVCGALTKKGFPLS